MLKIICYLYFVIQGYEEYSDIRIVLGVLKKQIYNYFLSSVYNNCQNLINYLKDFYGGVNFKDIFVTDATNIIIKCEHEKYDIFNTLLDWLYKNLYEGKMVERDTISTHTIQILFDRLKNCDELVELFNQYRIKKDPNESKIRHIVDLIAISTEDFVHNFINEMLIV